jgi:predicted acylesterase/phospholipase RssA
MKRRKYSVLAVDGGGIRGVIPARILAAIEHQLEDRPIAHLFDMVAGTSTGGIIALGLTKPSDDPAERKDPAYSAAEIADLYVQHGRELFPDQLLLKARTLFGLAEPRYPADAVEALMHERFGDTKLSQALTEVVIPAYDLSAPAPFFFKRSYAREEGRGWDVDMAVVARATSAAPTYFDPACLPAFPGEDSEHALVDGGMFANNPATAAYADALDLWGTQPEIHVVSLGTGRAPQQRGHGAIPVAYEDALHWGLARWARPTLEVVFDGVAKAVEYQMLRLCRHGDGSASRYYRLQSPLPTASHALDDASEGNVKRLLADADQLLHDDAAAETFDDICAMLRDVAADRDASAVVTAR